MRPSSNISPASILPSALVNLLRPPLHRRRPNSRITTTTPATQPITPTERASTTQIQQALHHYPRPRTNPPARPPPVFRSYRPERNERASYSQIAHVLEHPSKFQQHTHRPPPPDRVVLGGQKGRRRHPVCKSVASSRRPTSPRMLPGCLVPPCIQPGSRSS